MDIKGKQHSRDPETRTHGLRNASIANFEKSWFGYVKYQAAGNLLFAGTVEHRAAKIIAEARADAKSLNEYHTTYKTFEIRLPFADDRTTNARQGKQPCLH